MITMRSEVSSLRGRRPWNSAESTTPSMVIHFRDSQEHIDFCLNHCPFPDTECQNCFGNDYSGGVEHRRCGRPLKVSYEDMAIVIDTHTVKEIAALYGVSERTVRKMKKNIREGEFKSES